MSTSSAGTSAQTRRKWQDPSSAVMNSESLDNEALTRGIIGVRGRDVAAIARENTRRSALAGRAEETRNWLRVLKLIQQQE